MAGAVEKLKNSIFLRKQPEFGDRKCLGKPTTLFVGLRHAMPSRHLLVREFFRQPRTISTATETATEASARETPDEDNQEHDQHHFE
jgi:hypothetical protein